MLDKEVGGGERKTEGTGITRNVRQDNQVDRGTEDAAKKEKREIRCHRNSEGVQKVPEAQGNID